MLMIDFGLHLDTSFICHYPCFKVSDKCRVIVSAV